MYNKVRLWWKYNGRYLYKDFVNGVKNLWKWFPTIWKQRDWDHDFIYNILAKKLEFQAKYIGERSFHTNANHDAERIRLVVKLIKLEQDEFYNMEYMEYAENKHWFEPCKDKPGYSTWESENVWERYDEYFVKYPLYYKRAIQYIKDNQTRLTSDHTDKQLVAMIMGDLRQAKCKDLIFKIMSQDIGKWWD